MTDLTTTSTSSLDTTVDAWLEAYAEPDAIRRAALVTSTWAADGSLADPPFDASGHEAIAALTDLVLGHFPGHRFRRTTGIDEHHGVARYGWELVGPDGTVAVAGMDIAELAEDGRLRRVTGFFGDPPALA